MDDSCRSTDSQDQVSLLMEEDGKTDATAGRSRSGVGKYESPWKGRREAVKISQTFRERPVQDLVLLLVCFLSFPVQPAVLGKDRVMCVYLMSFGIPQRSPGGLSSVSCHYRA